MEGLIKITQKSAEEKKLYNTLYYIKNRDRLIIKNTASNKLRDEKQYECECGSKIKTCSKTKHLNTKKHEKLMELKQLSIK